jgi:Na+-transporting NADH:ubiquinone oxidoreductase subunit NqrB
MRSLIKILDAELNKYTMYRGLLYGLTSLLAIAEILAVIDAISISPVGLPISIITLIVSCYASNRLFAWLLKLPYNYESWLISALILACILPPAQTVERVLLIALCGAIAMASKYVIVYRGSNLLNPAAVGAFVMSVSGLLPSTWWIATPYLAPVTILLGLITLYSRPLRWRLWCWLAIITASRLMKRSGMPSCRGHLFSLVP